MFRIFNVSSTENMNLISAYIGILPIVEMLNLWRFRFVQSLDADRSIVYSLFYIFRHDVMFLCRLAYGVLLFFL